MKAQDLKNSILQLAIQGKLVEQREDEGTAKELIEKIKAEKEKLIKEGKIKKQKALPEIKEDEIPFDIPESWEWVRFGEMVNFNMGKTPPRSEPKYWKDDYNWVSIADMISDGYILETKEKISEIALNEKFKMSLVPKGTLLMSFKLTVGRVSILDIDAVHNEAIISIYPYADLEESIRNYLFTMLPLLSTYGETKGAIKGKTLNSTSLNNLLIPLPPLEEQKRIVAKIEELLPYVDQYDKAYTEVEELNKKFPDDMQKSILQYAIQGKLVEQRKEDGTAEELYQKIQEEKKKLIKEGKIKKTKTLPEITEDEIPFDIPKNWKWVRLGELISISSGKGLTSKQMLEGDVPVFGGNGVTGFHNRGNVDKITVVIGRVGYYCGSVHVTPTKAWVTDNAFITAYPENYIDRNYLVYILRHLNIGRDNNATAQPVVSGKKIYPILFPLPPLEEQKRIVEKIEELLLYTKQLVKKIN